MKESKNIISGLTKVLGGFDLVVKYIGQIEQVEVVKIHELTISKAQTYLRLCSENDEAGLIELFCDKKPGWADTLDRTSVEQVLQAGEELNADFMMRRAETRNARRQKLMPGFEEKTLERVMSAVMARLTPTLPTLPLPPGSPSSK